MLPSLLKQNEEMTKRKKNRNRERDKDRGNVLASSMQLGLNLIPSFSSSK